MIREVRRGSQAESDFHLLPWRLYAGDPHWTPPIGREELNRLDAHRNPTLRGVAAQRWVAYSRGRVAGRVAAFLNQQAPEGYVGFFECEPNGTVATALLRAAEGWLAKEGAVRVRGPIAINPRDQIGLLVDGFDRPATLLTPYNPPYYGELFDEAGYGVAVRLRSYRWFNGIRDRARVEAREARVARRDSFAIRTLDRHRLGSEAETIASILNDTFTGTWGYTPVTSDEAKQEARALRAIVDPRLILFAERNGEVLGTAVTVPDANWLARRIRGRLFPLGWLHALWLRRRIPVARMMILAVRPHGRAAGVAMRLITETHRRLNAGGYAEAELAQVFDENVPMRRVLDRIGVPVSRRFVVYERSLS
jgi:GNAT superfamily N-acetyltransferase